jgi:hypothetical protein
MRLAIAVAFCLRVPYAGFVPPCPHVAAELVGGLTRDRDTCAGRGRRVKPVSQRGLAVIGANGICGVYRAERSAISKILEALDQRVARDLGCQCPEALFAEGAVEPFGFENSECGAGTSVGLLPPDEESGDADSLPVGLHGCG